MRLLHFTALAALALAAPFGCALRSGPRIRSVKVRVTSINFKEVNVAIDVDVHNPTAHALPAPDYAIALYVESDPKPFRSDSGEATRRLPAGQTTTLSIALAVPYRKAIKRVRWLERSPTIPYRLRGSLRLSIEGQPRTVRFSHKGTLPILRAPQFTDIQFRIPTQVSPQMQLKFYTRLTNPNAFPIDVRNLRYEITLGGDRVGGLFTESSPVIGPGKSVWITLGARVNAFGALVKSGFDFKKLLKKKRRIAVRGSMKTPYGTIPLRADH